MNTMMAVAYDAMSRVSRRVRNVESEVIQNKDSSFLPFDPLSLSRISRTKKGGDEGLRHRCLQYDYPGMRKTAACGAANRFGRNTGGVGVPSRKRQTPSPPPHMPFKSSQSTMHACVHSTDNSNQCYYTYDLRVSSYEVTTNTHATCYKYEYQNQGPNMTVTGCFVWEAM